MGRINFDQESNVIIIDVFIEHNNIRKKVKMVLDTGATYMMISWELAEALKLHPEISKDRIDIITASGIEKVPLINLGKVSVSGKETENVKTTVHDLPEKSYVDGLLGLSFLKNFNIHLNFKDSFLTID